mgnify:CR=1 FL=1
MATKASWPGREAVTIARQFQREKKPGRTGQGIGLLRSRGADRFIEERRAGHGLDVLEGIAEIVVMILPGRVASLEPCKHGFKLGDDGGFVAVPRAL